MHRLVKNRWNKCEQENIVCIFPRPSPLREGSQWEEFCRIKILLHVCHRGLQQLTENGSIAWSILYVRHLDEINADPIDLLGLPTDDEESEISDDDGEPIEDDEDDEQHEFRPEIGRAHV